MYDEVHKKNRILRCGVYDAAFKPLNLQAGGGDPEEKRVRHLIVPKVCGGMDSLALGGGVLPFPPEKPVTAPSRQHSPTTKAKVEESDPFEEDTCGDVLDSWVKMMEL